MNSEVWVGEFTNEEFLRFREKVIEKSEEDPSQPIIIRINSYGGEVDALAAMIATINEVPNPIITVAYGMAMSCGAVLLSCGDVRWCDKNARIMIHEVSGGAGGDVHSVHADALELKRLNKLFMGLLAKNCGIDGGYDGLRKMIKARDGKDIYLSAEEALKFGIVDAIGVPKVVERSIFDIATVPPKDMAVKLKQKPSKTKKRIIKPKR